MNRRSNDTHPNSLHHRRILSRSIASLGMAAGFFAWLVGNAGSTAHAADITWDVIPGTVGLGDGLIFGGSGTWDLATGNWSSDGGVHDFAWDNTVNATDVAVFSDAPGGVTLGTPINAGGIRFDVSSYDIGNGGLTANTLNLGGLATVTVTNAADSDSISAVITGSAGLTKAGNGTLMLFGANTYTGGTFVNAGTLMVTTGASNTLGAAAVSVAIGAVLALDTGANSVTFANTVSGAGTVSFTGTANGPLLAGGSWGSFTGTLNVNTSAGAKLNVSGVTFNSTATVNVASGATFYSPTAVTLSNAFTVAGSGNTEGRGALRLDSGTVISGPVTLLGDATVGASFGVGTISGPITGAFGLATAATSTTITLSGNNSYTGATTVNGGILQLAQKVSLYSNTPALWKDTNIVVNSGGTLALNVGGAGEFTVNDVQTLVALGTGTGGFIGGSAIGLDTTNAPGGNFTYASGITNPNIGANALGLRKLGTGTLTLGGVNTYTGGTSIAAGTLALTGGTNSFAAAGGLAFTGAGTLDLGGNAHALGAISIAGAVNGTIANGNPSATGVAFSGNGAAALVATTLDVTGGLAVNASGTGVKSINAVLTGAGGLTVSANGSTTAGSDWTALNAVNTFTGNVTVNAGVLQVATNDNAALGDPANVLILNGGALFNNNATNLTLPATRAIQIGASGGALRVWGNSMITANGVISGSGALSKTDSGTLTLTGNNTYTGGTIVPNGVLNVLNDQSQANGGWTIGLTNATAATVNLQAGSSNALASGKTLQLGTTATNASGSLAATMNLAGQMTSDGSVIVARSGVINVTAGGLWTQSGPINLTPPSNSGFGAAVNVNTAGVFNYTGAIPIGVNSATANGGISVFTIAGGTAITGQPFNNSSSTGTGSGNLVLSTAGTLRLSANIPALATTAGIAFNVQVGTGGGIIDTNGFSTAITQAVTNVTSQTGSLMKIGNGTLTLSGNNTYTGGTIVNGGSLVLDYTTVNSKLADTGVLTLGGGTLTLANGASAHTEVVASSTLNAGGSAIARASGTSVLRMNGITHNAGAAVDFGAASMADTDATNTNGILGGYATVGGANWAINSTNAADGAITALGSYTTFVATAGAATTNYLQTGALSVTTTESANSLKITTSAAGQSLALGASTLTLTTGGLLFAGANDYAISGTGSLKSNTATNSDLIIQQYGAGKLTISAIIANGIGASTLTKAGTGALVLSGANTYTGATFIDTGTLQLGAAGVIPDGSSVTADGTLDVNAFNETIGGLNGNGVVNNTGASVATLTVGGGNGAGSFSGIIGNTGASLSLVKTGTGTQVISGTGLYSGTTTVAGGTLEFPKPAALYSDTPASWTEANIIVNSGGTLAFNVGGVNDFTAGKVQSLVALGNGSGGFLSGSTIGFDTTNAPGAFTYASAIVNPNSGANGLGLAKLGTNTLSLTGANTYSGNTVINAGTLSIGTASSLPGTTGLIFTNTSGTATLTLGGFAQTVAGMTFGTQTTGTNTITINGAGSSLTTSPTTLSFNPLSSANNLAVDMSALSAFTFNNSAGSVRINGGTAAGSSGGHTSIVTLPGGTNIITAASLGVGDNGTSNGVFASTLNLGLTNILNVNNLNVGTAGRNSATLQYAAAVTGAKSLVIRAADGVSGANLNVGTGQDSFAVTDVSTILFNASAGTLDAVLGNVNIGQASVATTGGRGLTTNATLNMGAGVMSASNMTVGSAGSNNNTQANGGDNLVANGTFTLGTGTANVTTLTLANNTFSGRNDHTTGTATDSVTVTGTVNINSGATLNATTIQKGGGGTGTFTSSNTATVNWASGTIGNIAGSNLSVSGVGVVLGSGTHTFNISAPQTGTVSSVISGTGTITNSGDGVLAISGANTFSGGWALNSGTLNINADSALGNASNLVTMNNATFQAGAANVSIGAGHSVLINSGSTATFDTNGNGLSIAGVIQNNVGSGAVTKIGAGTLTLSGSNTYTGSTLVSAGTLAVSGSISGSATTIDGATAMLMGTGTVGSVTLNNGTLTAGDGVAPLATGNLNLNGGTALFELAADGSSDRLVTAGSAAFGAPVELNLSFNSDLTVGTAFTIIDNDTAGDPFSIAGGAGFALSGTPIVPGAKFTFNSGAFSADFQLSYAGGDGNDAVLTVVPEPGSALCLLGGLGLLAGLRRRRKY